MNPILFVLFQVDMPEPPAPGGSASGEWWRIAGLIIMTILTTGILALIFRVPAVVGDGDEAADTPRVDEPPPTLPLRRAGDPPLAPVIAFPGREPIQGQRPDIDMTAIAAAERLRRLTHARTSMPSLERRRLGMRRVVREAPSSEAMQGPTYPTPPQVGSVAPTREAQTNPVERATGAERVVDQRANTDGPEEPGEQAQDRQAGAGKGAGDGMAGAPDAIELLGDVAERRPSEADRVPERPADVVEPDDYDLLGDIVNRSPSEMDRVVDETTRRPATMHGDVPTADEVDRIAAASSRTGKIVQFVPRQPSPAPSEELDPVYQLLDEQQGRAPEPVDAVIRQFPVDPDTREGVTSTVQELLFCANVGEFMHGFALYTDKFLFRFMVDSGLNEDEFRARYSNVPPKDPELWTRIEAIRDFQRLDDGRVSAKVRYIDGEVLDGIERFVFKHDPITSRWLIDDIQAVD